MKIKLVTASLELVAEKEIPPFLVLPEVILWGQRYYCLHLKSKDVVYREACCFVIETERTKWDL